VPDGGEKGETVCHFKGFFTTSGEERIKKGK
jgi:hypothetical protein